MAKDQVPGAQVRKNQGYENQVYEERVQWAQSIHQRMSATEKYQSDDITIFINAHIIDAQTNALHAWLAIYRGCIIARGNSRDDLSTFMHTVREKSSLGHESVRIIDVQGSILCPGYIDIHSHGGWGSSFDDGAEAIFCARAFHMTHGTTRQVLSLVTNPWKDMLRNVRRAAEVAAGRVDVVGLHAEGPFISAEHKGAHNEECLLKPTHGRVEELLEAAQGTLRHVTLAPELDGALSAISQLAAAGVVPAVGHCSATYEQVREAVSSGAHLLTHMYNGMPDMNHRNPGPVAAAYDSSDMIVELIADGVHVHPPILRAATQLFTHRWVLVSDSLTAAGCSDGSYTLGSMAVDVVHGQARIAGTQTIAGSTSSVEDAVKFMVHEVGIDIQATIEAATLTPARALGLDKHNNITRAPLGLLEPQYAADILILDEESLDVQHVWCEGVLI
ncbi:N-acetylglucosamine-6-phosphate deacetylase [Alloscardovia omnicolens]|uniref:N-acetylglucosamine-6-phosphate deacetylase n=1 Tax=Alloscardovia omnicolens TaxID=419015 RepID=UPI003A750BD7